MTPYWNKNGQYGAMGLKEGDRFRNAYALEKGYHDSYHRAGVGVDFCVMDRQGAYSCLVTHTAPGYDQDSDDGTTVRFQQPTLETANRALEQSMASGVPVRLFMATYVDDPEYFAPMRFIVFRGMFIVSSFDPDTRVYFLSKQ